MQQVKRAASFTEGSLFFKIVKFVIPIMLTGILQTVYNMADNIVVGKFSGDEYALGSVGSASSMTNLTINLLLGLSLGVSVVVAQGIGARDDAAVRKGVHTGMLTALYGGIIFMLLGLVISRPVFQLLEINENFIEGTILYFRIICIGIPANAVYNFGAAILRSAGDSKTPLIILSSAGLINVLCNLIFVIGFGMSVAGVAIATIISQYLSAVAVIILLFINKNEKIRMSLKELRMDKAAFVRIVKIGVPTGVQSAMFNVSNVIFASGVNSLAPETITANSIAASIDNLTYISINSVAQASTTCVGQNYGANRMDRVKKSYYYCLIQGVVIGVVVAAIELLLSDSLIGLFMPDDTGAMDKAFIISEVKSIMFLILPIYFFTTFMDVTSNTIRALGSSTPPMIISIVGICVLRIVWILTVFKTEAFHTIIGIYLAYPTTWLITTIVLVIWLIILIKRILKKNNSIYASLD